MPAASTTVNGPVGRSLAAADFFTTKIYTLSGPTRHMVLASIHYATRKVDVVDIIQQAYAR